MQGIHDAREVTGHRLVFVGGLHRSGTTLLADLLGEHPAISALHDTGAPHDEGQHLQDVMPTARAAGGPGVFAFEPSARLTEADVATFTDAPARLAASWSPYWDLDRRLLLEKSPPNLLRFRFLQAVFPGAACIAITRHPVAVAYATEHWAGASIPRLIGHWLHAHELFERDRPAIDRLLVLRYEDLVRDVPATLALVTDFLGVEPFRPQTEVRSGTNDRYLRRWQHGRAGTGRIRVASHAARFERRLRALPYGYSLRDLDA